MVFEEVPFVLGRQIAVVGHPFVMTVRYQVHDVLFEIGPGATDDLYLILTDHFSQGYAQFGCAHGAGDGHHHFATVEKVRFVAFGGVDEGSGVEVPVMMLDELGNGTFVHSAIGISRGILGSPGWRENMTFSVKGNGRSIAGETIPKAAPGRML
jgi:hypothetical protein